MTAEVVLHPGDDVHGHGWVDEIGCTHLDGFCPCQQELDGVRAAHDAAQADDGDVDGMRHLPHHAQGYGLDGRAAQSARDGGENGAPLLGIDGHAQQGVDERHAVGTGLLDGTGYLHDVRHIGRELDDECLVVGCTYRTNHRCCTFGGDAERHAPLLHIGTGDVEFNSRYPLQRVDALGHSHVVVDG